MSFSLLLLCRYLFFHLSLFSPNGSSVPLINVVAPSGHVSRRVFVRSPFLPLLSLSLPISLFVSPFLELTTGGSLFVPAERGDTCHTGNQAPPRGCTCSLCWRFTRQNRKKVKVLRERESDARR